MTLSYRLPGLNITDHEFTVPLDHARPAGPQLQVFARELAETGGETRPYLVYFQGGPGHEGPRPVSLPDWMRQALKDHRLLLLDQRGTGRSSPVGTLPGLSAAEQAAYLRHFRADAIVQDAELIRQALGQERWSVLGQSFGGFCVVTYLSFAPHGLKEAFITGGLPPIGRPTAKVYRATYSRVAERNERFYARHPQHLAKVRAIRERLRHDPPTLPTGDLLTPRRFQQLGQNMGMGLEALHYLLDFPLDSPAFLHGAAAAFPYGRNPLYAVIHEACYADGVVTDWAAQREYPADWPDEWFTGEMVYPWMFDEASALRPLADAARLLAQESWPRLYDAAQLARNTVPVAALVYANDMYVERAFSEETAAATGNMRLWLTGEYEHNGLHVAGDHIVERLMTLAREPR